MFKLKLLDGGEVEVRDYRDFLLLRFLNQQVNVPQFGRTLFEMKLDSVCEVIATEGEILLQIEPGFDAWQLPLDVAFSSLKKTAELRNEESCEHVLPVRFSDHNAQWQKIEQHTGLRRRQYIESILSCDLKVAMCGFLPGFIYLDGLPDELHVPRQLSPANRTDPGSFAIGGKYAGVYSLASPAGWNVIGRTARQLFRLNQIPPLEVGIGDAIKIQQVDELPAEPQEQTHAESEPEANDDLGQFTVLKSGMLTLIQDQGRAGLAHYAIPRSGALDADSAGIANALLGNPVESAVIECHFVAPKIRFDSAGTICLSGADMNWSIDGCLVNRNRSISLSAGSCLEGSKAKSGCRGYIAVHGQVKGQKTFGSMSAYRLGGFGVHGGKPLRAGDVVRWEKPHHRCPRFDLKMWNAKDGEQILKLIPGPEFEWLDEDSMQRLTGCDYSISRESNRMGARLLGPILRVRREMNRSVPLLPGMIQLTRGGQPIVVLNDGQTSGGYPRIGYLSCPERQKFVQIAHEQAFRFTLCD